MASEAQNPQKAAWRRYEQKKRLPRKDDRERGKRDRTRDRPGARAKRRPPSSQRRAPHRKTATSTHAFAITMEAITRASTASRPRLAPSSLTRQWQLASPRWGFKPWAQAPRILRHS